MNHALASLITSLVVILSGCAVDPAPPTVGKGNRIYYRVFDITRFRIASVNPDGSSPNQILLDARMFCSPRGGRIAYSRAIDSGLVIAVANLDGSHEHIIDTSRNGVEPIVLSPNGETVAYCVGDTLAIRHLWIANIATGVKRQITIPYQRKQHYYQQITFSPDGRRVGVNAGPNIHIIDVRDLSERLLNVAAVDGDTVTWIAWAPQGERIAFETHRLVGGSGWIGLHIINADGSGRSTLLDHTMAIGDFTWSPRGDAIAVGRIMPTPGAPVSQTQYQLWTLKADGSDARMVVADSVVITAPQWSPDGNEIVYQANVSTTPGILAYALGLVDLRTGTKRIVVRDAMDPHW